MILVDSSVWIAYFNGQMNWQSNLLDRPSAVRTSADWRFDIN